MKHNFAHRLLRRLHRDQRGAVAVTFLLTSTIMLGGSFGAIDLVRHNVAQGRLQNSLDAAVISAGRNLANRTPTPGTPDADAWRNDAYNFFRSNMPNGYLGSSVSTDDLQIAYEEETSGDYRIGQFVEMSVKGDLPLISTGFLKVTSFGLAASNQALRRTRSDLEVVLVVDSSGSMDTRDPGSSKTRIAHLRDASKLLVEMILGAAEANENSRTFVGVVPFTHVVNVGNNAISRSWLTSGWRNSSYATDVWKGCITEPRPVNNRPIADVAPANNGPNYFRPLYRDRTADVEVSPRNPHTNVNTMAATFTPDPLGHRRPSNINQPNNIGTGNYVVPTRQEVKSGGNNSTTKYYLRLSFLSNPSMCDVSRAASFLSNDATAINNAINSLKAEGGTAVPAGLLWGWRMLHPVWSGQWGGASVDLGDDGSATMPRPPHRDLTKVLILLTDGANSVEGSITSNEGFRYSATYMDTGKNQRTLSGNMTGGVSHAINNHNSLNDSNRELTPAGGDSTSALDTFTRQLCNNIKNPNDAHVPGGIKLYTVAFGPVSDPRLMRDCASNNGFYDSTNVNNLSQAFESIAGDLMELRLTR